LDYFFGFLSFNILSCLFILFIDDFKMAGFGGSFLLVFVVGFLGTFGVVPWIIPKLRRAGFVGKDVNKPDRPEIPNIGGFSVVFGFSCGVLIAIGLASYLGVFGKDFELVYVLAGFCTVLLMSIVGVFDDLFSMHKLVKAVLPLFASLPLVAVNAGATSMFLPFVGEVQLGLFYTLFLIPIGITGASNVTNMLAGFNGLEAGMGFVGCVVLGLIGLSVGKAESAVLLFAMAGSLLAFFYFSRFPAKIFIGDTGTLAIGAVYASAVIIGNYEVAGVIIIVPYALDFFIKASNRFPSSNWWGEYVNGKLVCRGRPVGLCQMIMKITGGISEQNLVLFLVALELVFGLIALFLFVKL
jgi:UDP-N-acetylglucosamine--dolichyl-phosphate N-acetylglucosaminephosphotransferase